MIKIFPSSLSGDISIVSSKSLSHRYVIAAALAEGKSIIDNILDSDDLIATTKALENLGAHINGNEITGGKVRSVGSKIDANESGSTLRFLIPIAMLQKEDIEFVGHGKLPFRPLNVYEDLFKDKYKFIKKTENELPLVVAGPLKSDTYYLPGNISSQFITGLLYALPLVDGDSKIVITTNLESKGYVDLTLDVLKEFGIKIIQENNTFLIKGNQKYQPINSKVEGDFSGAAFFIAAGLLGEEITLKNLNKMSSQGDKEIIDFAIQMNGDIQFKNNDLVVKPSKLKATTIDIGQTPDLGPILMVMAALSDGVTTIKNVSRLRIKESDRLDAMVQNLSKMGVEMTLLDDAVMIKGRKELEGNCKLSSYGDHRIAMACAIASIKANGVVEIDDEKVVSKSYPTFFSEFIRLGGKIE